MWYLFLKSSSRSLELLALLTALKFHRVHLFLFYSVHQWEVAQEEVPGQSDRRWRRAGDGVGCVAVLADRFHQGDLREEKCTCCGSVPSSSGSQVSGPRSVPVGKAELARGSVWQRARGPWQEGVLLDFVCSLHNVLAPAVAKAELHHEPSPGCDP